MSKTIIIRKLQPENISSIVEWCREKDKDFLQQWAGVGYSYPLTAEQINDRLVNGARIFEAFNNGKMIGTIELIETYEQDNTALVGRFVVNPAIVGQGFGGAIMTEFLRYCKEELMLSAVTLYVFDFNAGAFRCYQKCGFAEIERVERSNGWIAIKMSRRL